MNQNNYVGHGPIRDFDHMYSGLNILNFGPNMNGKGQYVGYCKTFLTYILLIQQHV